MNKPTFFVLSLMLFLAQISFAQSSKNTLKPGRFELEIDPIAYMLKGYSVHGIYRINRMRFDLGVFGIEQPGAYTGNKDFTTYTQGIGGKINYLLNAKQTWFAGIGGGYADSQITLKETNATQHLYNWSLGVLAGYRFYLLRNTRMNGLYLTPWASIDYNMPVNSVHFEGKTYLLKRWSVFPTIHIGYRF